MQVNPKQVDASGVGVAGGKRIFVGHQVKGVLGATVIMTVVDCQGERRLDVVKHVMTLDDIPCMGKLLNVGQVRVVLFPSMEFNMCGNPTSKGCTRHRGWHHCCSRGGRLGLCSFFFGRHLTQRPVKSQRGEQD